MDVVLMGRWPYSQPLKFEGPEDFAVGHEMLSRVDLDQLADRSILALSGGERQRAVIARALAQQPQVLLLDEPTAFLDLNHQLQIFHILKQLNGEKGLTMVVVSHDLNLAAQFCHRVIMMNHGQIIRMGPCEEVITAPLVEEIYGCRAVVDPHPITGKPRVTLIP
jgi:iron complex transport system ATP-binding protein